MTVAKPGRMRDSAGSTGTNAQPRGATKSRPMASAGTQTEAETVGRRPAAAALASDVCAPIMLAGALRTEAGWGDAQFGHDGPNPPYLRIGGKLWVTLTEYEPCFSSMCRDRGFFRSKVSIAALLETYDQLMVDPIAFEECFGPGEGTEATFPFGAWLTIRGVGFEGITLWGRRAGRVMLPLEPLAVASAIWLRRAPALPAP